MPSADFSDPIGHVTMHLAFRQHQRSPGVRRNCSQRLYEIYLHELRLVFGILYLMLYSPPMAAFYLVSVRYNQPFAFSFLQIPPHDGHPYLSSWFLPARPTGDFNPQPLHHARRTSDIIGAFAPIMVNNVNSIEDTHKTTSSRTQQSEVWRSRIK